MTFTDEYDRTKKAVNHVATTSRRVRFHEVELRPNGSDSGEEDGGNENYPKTPMKKKSDSRTSGKGKNPAVSRSTGVSGVHNFNGPSTDQLPDAPLMPQATPSST